MTQEQSLESKPLLHHLMEFRRRATMVAVGYVLACVACYGFAEDIYEFLVRPLADSFADPHARRLIYTGLVEAFLTYVKLTMFAAFFVSFPWIAWQTYAYLAPGLYRHERRVLIPYFIGAPLLFVAGASLAYFVVFPLAWKFFLSFESSGSQGGLPIMLEARVSEYLALSMQMIMAFGLSFQLPVIISLLARAGMVSAATLSRGRRYAVVIGLTLAAFLTPPDIFSQIILFIPLYFLYELSIFLARGVEKKTEAKQEIQPLEAQESDHPPQSACS